MSWATHLYCISSEIRSPWEYLWKFFLFWPYQIFACKIGRKLLDLLASIAGSLMALLRWSWTRPLTKCDKNNQQKLFKNIYIIIHCIQMQIVLHKPKLIVAIVHRTIRVINMHRVEWRSPDRWCAKKVCIHT